MSAPRSFFFLCLSTLFIVLALGTVSADDALHCPKCDRHFPKEPRYCPGDGTRLKRVKMPQMGCPHCGRVFINGEKFCPADGFKLKLQKPVARICKKCQRSFSGGEMFCPFDGQGLAADTRSRELKVAKKPAPETPKEPVRLVKPKIESKKAKAKATLTRQVVRKFAATPKKTGMIRFALTKAGTMKARVEYSGDMKVIVYLFAPGFTKPIATKEGFSPLVLESSIDEATITLKKKFEVWVAPRDGTEVFGKVTLTLPTDGFSEEVEDTPKKKPESSKPKDPKLDIAKKAEPKPKSAVKPTKKSESRSKEETLPFKLDSAGTFSHVFKVEENGRIDVRVEFDSGRELYVKLRDPKKKVDLVRKQGKGPIQLFYQVTGGARTFRLWIIDLEGKSSQGKITITKP